jgi:hypothetical protein
MAPFSLVGGVVRKVVETENCSLATGLKLPLSVFQDNRPRRTNRPADPTLCRENKVQVFLAGLISFDSEILNMPSGEERIAARND